MTYIWILLRQVAAAAQCGCWAPAYAPHRLPCRAAQVVAAAVAVAPPTAVAGDCAPRLGTWPTLKKVGKSCQEEKGSGTPSAYHCAPWHSFDDIVAQVLVKEKRGSKF